MRLKMCVFDFLEKRPKSTLFNINPSIKRGFDNDAYALNNLRVSAITEFATKNLWTSIPWASFICL